MARHGMAWVTIASRWLHDQGEVSQPRVCASQGFDSAIEHVRSDKKSPTKTDSCADSKEYVGYVGNLQVHESTQQARRRLLEALDVCRRHQFITVLKFDAKCQACWAAMLRNLEKCQLMILCPAMSNVSRPFWWFMCVFLSCFMMKLDETCYRRYLSWADANRIRTRLTNAFHVPWWSWNLQIHVKYIYMDQFVCIPVHMVVSYCFYCCSWYTQNMEEKSLVDACSQAWLAWRKSRKIVAMSNDSQILASWHWIRRTLDPPRPVLLKQVLGSLVRLIIHVDVVKLYRGKPSKYRC